jgi:hypothetical protein
LCCLGEQLRTGRCEPHEWIKALLRLYVTFVKRDRQFVAVQQDAHCVTAGGFAHDNAGVSFYPGAAFLAEGGEPDALARFLVAVTLHRAYTKPPHFSAREATENGLMRYATPPD